jgi:hypothetical protein
VFFTSFAVASSREGYIFVEDKSSDERSRLACNPKWQVRCVRILTTISVIEGICLTLITYRTGYVNTESVSRSESDTKLAPPYSTFGNPLSDIFILNI